MRSDFEAQKNVQQKTWVMILAVTEQAKFFLELFTAVSLGFLCVILVMNMQIFGKP